MGQAGSKVVEQELSEREVRPKPTPDSANTLSAPLVVTSCGSTKHRQHFLPGQSIAKATKQHHGFVRALPAGRPKSLLDKEAFSSLASNATHPAPSTSARFIKTSKKHPPIEEIRTIQAPAVPMPDNHNTSNPQGSPERLLDFALDDRDKADEPDPAQSSPASSMNNRANAQSSIVAVEGSPPSPGDSDIPRPLLDSRTHRALRKLSTQLIGLAEQPPEGWEVAIEVPMSRAERDQNRQNIELAISRLRDVRLPENGRHTSGMWQSRPLLRLFRRAAELDDEVNLVPNQPKLKIHTAHHSLKRLRGATPISPGPLRKKSRTEADSRPALSPKWASRQRRMTGLWKGWESMIAGKRELESL